MPCTPPPGGVDAEHRYTPRIAVRYGFHRGVGRSTVCSSVAGPAVDVAADVVRVVALHVRGGPDRLGQDQVAEAGREALDLRLDAGRTCRHGLTRGHVAVGPEGVLPGGRAGRVDHARLGDQAVRPLRHAGPRSRRPRCGPPRPASRRGARCPPPGTPGPATGTGPLSAKSTLQTPGPYLNRSQRAPVAAAVSRSPASAISWRGVTSSRTVPARAAAHRGDRTQWPVSTSPPRASSSASSASVMPGAAALHHRPAHRVRQHGRAAARTRRSPGRSAAASSARPPRRAAPCASLGVETAGPASRPGAGRRRPNRAIGERMRGAPTAAGRASRARSRPRRGPAAPISRR